jgi:hypothetical protein
MSTKRIYKVVFQVFWKDKNGGEFPSGHETSHVFTELGVVDACAKLTSAKSKVHRPRAEDSAKFSRIDISSCELVAESEIG